MHRRRQALITLLVSGQHLVEKLVGHATSNKLLLGQNTILVLVHLAEDLLCTPLGCVSGIVVSQLWTDHVVDRLHTPHTTSSVTTCSSNEVAYICAQSKTVRAAPAPGK